MVWLPYTAIDQLLQALQESTTNHHNVVVGPAAPGEKGAEGWQGAPQGQREWDAGRDGSTGL